jgi:hypothetical protein
MERALRSSRIRELTVLLAAILLGGTAPAVTPAADRAVVVELFTSQGCSSCPPADRLLRRLADDPDLAGRVLPLAYHVDYWNYLGWRDPFSAREWSERQRRYATALGERGVYTPQLVVDGVSHCVGSQRGEVMEQIRDALSRPEAATIQLDRVTLRADSLEVEVRARRNGSAAGGPLTAWAAVVEDGLRTPVGRGENAGRRLENDRVVRTLVSLFSLPSGDAQETADATEIPLQPGWDRNALGVVVFLQDPRTLAIQGGAAWRSPSADGRAATAR